MPKATAEPTTPPTPTPYRLGRHPRRTDHPALLQPDGTLAVTFHLDATRTEIAGILRDRGLTLHDDDTVTWAPAASEPAPTRRHLLAGLAGATLAATALATSAATATESPDAELLAMCARAELLEIDYERRSHDDTIPWDEMLPPGYSEAIDLVEMTPALTLAGMRAKARVAIGHFRPDDDPDQGLAWSLIRDVAGWGVAA